MLRLLLLTTTSMMLAAVAKNTIRCSQPNEECVPIKECQPVMRLLRSRPSINTYNDVRQSICAWQDNSPSVCCNAQIARPDEAGPPQHRSDIIVNRIQHQREEQVQQVAPDRVDPSHPSLQLLDHERCGPIGAELRIHGGSPTRLFEFPWMGLLAYRSTMNSSRLTQISSNSSRPRPDFRCGASIINEKYLITAAHCVAHLPKTLKLVGVRVGEHTLDTEMDCEVRGSGSASVCAERYRDFGIESVHIHSDYSPMTLQNDIALIRIEGKLSFQSASIRPICLPLDPASMLPGIRFGVVTGWGSREDGVTLSNQLLKVRLPIRRAEACEYAYRDQPLVQLWYKQLCAGGEPGQDSCTGDSGGPLQTLIRYPYTLRRPIRFVQIGIVSFGRSSCAASDVPAVYTNIAYYLLWLLDNMHP